MWDYFWIPTPMSEGLIEGVKRTISRYAMLSPGENILIGLSGGPDSVCLIRVLTKIKDEMSLNLYASYIDHGLRPYETPKEIEFCANLCANLSVPFRFSSINVKEYAAQRGLSKQEAARYLRYDALREIALELGASRIALGHNADDQVETFLINLLRGTGPRGLAGIPPVNIIGVRGSGFGGREMEKLSTPVSRTPIIRPLIETTRADIERFLEEEGLGYVIDSSNLKEDYLRNFLRLSLIPELKKVNPSLTETMLRMMNILREEEGYFDLLVTKALMRMITRNREGHIELFLSPMETIDIVLLRRLLRRVIDEVMGLKRIGFVHIEDILRLIKKGKAGDRIYLPDNVRVIKGYSTLIITCQPPVRLGNYSLSVPGDVFLKETGIRIRGEVLESVESLGDGMTTLVVDADKTGDTLRIRPRIMGDFFYPMGFGRRKKLQDLFIDEKIPRDERDSIPLVLKGNDIIWVVGLRGDMRFKVTKDTKRFLRLKVERR